MAASVLAVIWIGPRACIAAIVSGLPSAGRRRTAAGPQMVIGEANEFVSKFHDRMPIILEEQDFKQWEAGSTANAAALMKPAADGIVQCWPVSMQVNSSRTPGDNPKLIERVELAVDGQLRRLGL